MNIAIIVIICVVAIAIIYTLSEYNNLIRLRNSVKEAFSTMDVYLKKRWDLIPNLVEVVKGYTKYESDIFKNITKIRAMSYDKLSIEEKANIDENLDKGLTEVIAVAENYPDLKANENYLELMNQLSKIEDDVANARKYYNAVVKNLNNKIEMFPSNIIASMFKFKQAKMFEAEKTEKNNIKVDM